jgi:hypothetical protein
MSDRFAPSEKLDDSEKINRTWEINKENIKILAKDSVRQYERKRHRPWFDEGYSKFIDERSRLNCFHYRITAKFMHQIRKLWDVSEQISEC